MATHRGTTHHGRPYSAPLKPAGAAEQHARLTALKANAELARFATHEIEAAERAVETAAQVQPDHRLGERRVRAAADLIDHALRVARARQAAARRND